MAASPSVRSSARRVAFLATGIVAAIYLLVAATVVVLATTSLTSLVDARLDDALGRLETGGSRGPGRGFESPRMDRLFGPTFLVWTVLPDGRITSNTVSEAVLPVDPSTITKPRTVEVAGIPVRVAGVSIGASHVVVGQTLDAVTDARDTILTAELLIAPILLLVVFLGALAVGRRAAAPIEAARIRQMAFTADASHELRTPLSVIEAQTQLALAHPRSGDWYRNAFGRIESESARMRRLVEDLLWLARFDADRNAPDAEPVDVGLLAAGTVDRFLAVAETRGIRLALAGPPPPAIVTAPPEWLDRLLGVLVDNACRYAPDGGRVRVTVRVDEGRIEAIVEDDGPGIPLEERGRIFDRFHRATDRPGGAGLGLAIGDAIVRATGGRWRIDASALGGASVAVSWPRSVRA